MGVFETIAGQLSAAAVTTAQAFIPNTPNTYTVRNATGQQDANLVSMWANVTVSGQVRVRSARLHDAQQAINTRQLNANPSPTLTNGSLQGLYSQDLLTVEYLADTAPVASSIQCHGMTIYYPSLVGGSTSSSRTWAEVEPYINNILGQEVIATTSATGGLWGAGSVLNSQYDVFKAGKNYAVLGYTTSDVGNAWGLSGADTGNYIVGGPLTTDALVTKNYFVDLANSNGLPLIPVISANNKLSTIVQVAAAGISQTVHIGLILAELAN